MENEFKILYDMHCHTKLSLCAESDANITQYARDAKANGLKVIGISDHSWEREIPGAIPWYQAQDYERLEQSREEARAAEKETGVRILLGAEGEVANGTLGFNEKSVSKLNFLIVPHSHTHMKDFVIPASYTEMKQVADFLVKSIYNVCTDPLSKIIFGIAHPMQPCGYTKEQTDEIFSCISDADLEKICTAAREHDVALEFNDDVYSGMTVEQAVNYGYSRIFRIGKKCGCDFFTGSDRHDSKISVKDTLGNKVEIIKALGLEMSDFENALNKALNL